MREAGEDGEGIVQEGDDGITQEEPSEDRAASTVIGSGIFFGTGRWLEGRRRVLL